MTPPAPRRSRSFDPSRGNDERPPTAVASGLGKRSVEPYPRPAIALPDPPLADPVARIVLRPWALSDVAALVAAWADPVIAAANGVPDDVSVSAATRWIRGAGRASGAGAVLDLVIGPFDGGATVLGEVGLRNIDRGASPGRDQLVDRRRASRRRPRRRGGSPAGGLGVVRPGRARPGVGSHRPDECGLGSVAAAVGLVALGSADGTVVWSCSRPASPPPSGP